MMFRSNTQSWYLLTYSSVHIKSDKGVKLTNKGTIKLYFKPLEGGTTVALATDDDGVSLPTCDSPYKVTCKADGTGTVISTIVYTSSASLQVIAGESYEGAKFSATVAME